MGGKLAGKLYPLQIFGPSSPPDNCCLVYDSSMNHLFKRNFMLDDFSWKFLHGKQNLSKVNSLLDYKTATNFGIKIWRRKPDQDLNKKFKNLNYKKLEKINLHTQNISEFSAKIAKVSAVRKILKKYQLSFIKRNRKCCIEGRDISTKILPKAKIKFFYDWHMHIQFSKDLKLNFSAFFILAFQGLTPFGYPWYICLPLCSFIILISFSRVLDCPMTRYENKLRVQVGRPTIKGFIGHYFLKPYVRRKIRKARAVRKSKEQNENKT